MSEQSVTMTADKRKQLADALDSHHVNGKCPRCGQNKWISGQYVPVPISDDPVLRKGSWVLPLAAMTCEGCGFTALHNLVVLGIVPPDAPSDGKASDEKPVSEVLHE